MRFSLAPVLATILDEESLTELGEDPDDVLYLGRARRLAAVGKVRANRAVDAPTSSIRAERLSCRWWNHEQRSARIAGIALACEHAGIVERRDDS